MKTINYLLANGQVVEINVPDDVSDLTVQFKREDENHARKMRDRKEKSIDAMAEYGVEVAGSQDIAAEAEQKELFEGLNTAVKQLPEKQQKLIRLHYYEGMSLAQIARETGISKQALSQQLQVIHKKLKNILKQP